MVRALALLLALAACDKQERGATAAAPGPAAHHPDAEKVFQACLAGSKTPSALPPRDHAIAISNACVDIHSVRGCREAFDDMAKAPPSEAINILFTRCAAAYCPLLPAPRPAACDRMPDGHADRLVAWLALEKAIVTFELGEERARVLTETTTTTTVEIDLPPVEAPMVEDPEPKLVVSITRDGKLLVGAKVVDDVLQALTEARKNGRDAIYIDADEEASYAAVVQVMSAAKQAGITKVQLITDKHRAGPKKPSR
jgi:biopolymer transport protein ExbD